MRTRSPDIHLVGGQQICQRINNVAFDGALQVPRPVALVGSLLQQEFPAGRRHTEQKLARSRVQDSFSSRTWPSSISRTASNSACFNGWKTTILSRRFMNSGDKLAMRRFHGRALQFHFNVVLRIVFRFDDNDLPPTIISLIFAATSSRSAPPCRCQTQRCPPPSGACSRYRAGCRHSVLLAFWISALNR